ncbi:hypothetical protein HFO71_10455 [Rhizobium laguerreae]|uniref:restriction endonuclease subunit S n=1 Tax=Rhizobium laguerreae TaxID=1076926 RepID=UPI001C918136|nr:hypothetical protein [Rhizobium laguerreae]
MSWQELCLSEVCSFENGDRGKNYPGKSALLDEGMPFVNAGDLEEGMLRVNGLSYISLSHYQRLSNGKFSEGDFLFCLRGSLGKFAFVDRAIEGAIASSLIIIRPRTGLHPGYLKHYLASDLCSKEIASYANGAAQPNLAASSLKQFKIPLPPFDKQKQIAAILDKADQLRQKRRQAIALLGSLTQSIFLEMFGEPVSNPRGFAVKELQEIVDPDRKITYGILMPGPDVPDGVPYVRVVDMRDGLVLVDQLRRTTSEIAKEYRRSSLRAGDLLVSIRGHVGRLAVTPPKCGGANITQDTARLAIAGANPLYVSALLSTSEAQHWMSQRTKGVAVRGINLGDLKKFPVMLPAISEQNDFARQVEQKLKVLQLKEAQLNSSESLFSSLQHRAFAGQL